MVAHSPTFLSPHAVRVERALHARLDDCRSDVLADTLRAAANVGPPEPASLVLATAEYASESDGDSEDGPLEFAVALGLIETAARVHAALVDAPGAPTVLADDEFDETVPPMILAGDIGFAFGLGSITAGDDPDRSIDRFGTLAGTMADVTAGIWRAIQWNGQSLDDIEAAMSSGMGSLYATALVVGVGDAGDEEDRAAMQRIGRHIAVAVVLRRCVPLREELDRAGLLEAADCRADERATAAYVALDRINTSLQRSLETVLDGVLDDTIP